MEENFYSSEKEVAQERLFLSFLSWLSPLLRSVKFFLCWGIWGHLSTCGTNTLFKWEKMKKLTSNRFFRVNSLSASDCYVQQTSLLVPPCAVRANRMDHLDVIIPVNMILSCSNFRQKMLMEARISAWPSLSQSNFEGKLQRGMEPTSTLLKPQQNTEGW